MASTTLLLVVAVVALVVVRSQDSPAGPDDTAISGGPLEAVPLHGWLVEYPPGTVFTDGLEQLRLSGDREATLVSVQSIGGEGALELVGALVAGPQRTIGALQTVPRFPPRAAGLGELSELEGLTILPFDETDRMGYELVLGYRVVDDAPSVRDGIAVTYEVGGDRYRRVLDAQLVYCGPTLTPADCEAFTEEHSG